MDLPLIYRDSGGSFPEIAKILFLDPPITRTYAPAEFIVDTGSHRSLINPEVAAQLEMPTSKLTFRENSYIGGSLVKTAEVQNITVKMRGDRHDEIYETEHDFLVGHYHGNQAANIGCILGMDFIVSNDLQLIVDGRAEPDACLKAMS